MFFSPSLMKTATDMVGSWLVKFYKLVTIYMFYIINFFDKLSAMDNYRHWQIQRS